MKQFAKYKLVMFAVLAAGSLSACNDKKEPVPTPAPTPPTSAEACSQIAGCQVTATGYRFSDNNGGYVVCENGVCTNQNGGMAENYDAGFGLGHGAGSAAGQSAGYQ